MRTLTLMRHAKSSWDEPDLSDHERPLNKRGKNAIVVMADRLKMSGYRPDLLVVSTALRARETAKRFAKQYGGTIGLKEEPQLYAASPETYEKIIRMTDDRVEHLMIVAHNPEMETVVALMAGSDYAMPTAAYARFDIPDPWKEFTLRRYVLADYDFPKSSR